MNEYMIVNDELYHHGVKGMKWGRRKAKTTQSQDRPDQSRTNQSRTNRSRERAKLAAAAVGGALAAYGAYKVSKAIKDKYFSHYMSMGMRSAERLMSQGQGERALNNLREGINYHRNVSALGAIKRTISNNSVNGKVDWKAVRNVYK